MPLNLSIVIPIYNEADNILRLLNHLIDNSSQKYISEIILVDGGSKDGSVDLVNEFINSTENHLPIIKLITSKKGRAKQMNEGAKQAKGSILYFLHADSFPPKNYDKLIIKEVEKGNLAGCFKMKFDSDHWWLRLASWLTHFRWRACRGGDQSQFVTKELFNAIGGYDEDYIIYEDNILINELFARNQFVVIQEWLTSSARLYRKKGVWKLQYHFWAIYVKKWFGATPEQLHQYYLRNIK